MSYEEHFSLTEHWKAGPFLALQESEIGYIAFDNQLNTTDLIDTQLNYPSVTSDSSTSEGCSRPSQCGVFQCWQIGRERRKNPGDILQGESPTEPFLLLCVNQIPIYVRRKNLTGLHFRIATINVSIFIPGLHSNKKYSYLLLTYIFYIIIKISLYLALTRDF